MPSGSRPSPEGTRLPFAGVVRPVLWCVQLMDNIRTTKRARLKTSQDEGRNKDEKDRPQRGGGFSLNLYAYLPGVSRWSGVISHDISRYIVIFNPISCDITRYDISRYHVHIPIFRDWCHDIVSHRNVSRYRTLFFASLVHQESKRNGYSAVEVQKQWSLLKKLYARPYGGTQSADLNAVLWKNKSHNLLREKATNKNDIIPQLSNCSSSSDD